MAMFATVYVVVDVMTHVTCQSAAATAVRCDTGAIIAGPP